MLCGNKCKPDRFSSWRGTPAPRRFCKALAPIAPILFAVTTQWRASTICCLIQVTYIQRSVFGVFYFQRSVGKESELPCFQCCFLFSSRHFDFNATPSDEQERTMQIKTSQWWHAPQSIWQPNHFLDPQVVSCWKEIYAGRFNKKRELLSFFKPPRDKELRVRIDGRTDESAVIPSKSMETPEQKHSNDKKHIRETTIHGGDKLFNPSSVTPLDLFSALQSLITSFPIGWPIEWMKWSSSQKAFSLLSLTTEIQFWSFANRFKSFGNGIHIDLTTFPFSSHSWHRCWWSSSLRTPWTRWMTRCRLNHWEKSTKRLWL